MDTSRFASRRYSSLAGQLETEPERPVLVWGAGRAGVSAIRDLRDSGIEPAAVLDSACARQGHQVEGLAVHAPSYLQTLRADGISPLVVVASIHADQIVEQAAASGLAPPGALCVPRDLPARAVAADPAVPEFYALLHELRGHALADMPRGARTMLSAGCSGRWYFDWIEQTYGPVERHIGVEAFLPRPDDLPANVAWLAQDVSTRVGVGDATVDLVFSGQNLEHLWPEQVTGFLCEAHRVLAPGGCLVLDSPNRELTSALQWSHPEHTIEYSVTEIRELLALAGFAETTVRGLWLCREGDELWPLSPHATSDRRAADVLRRAALARRRPDASFVWWAEARKRHAVDADALARAVGRIFSRAWPERLARFVTPLPVENHADARWAAWPAGYDGVAAEGPMFPLRPGRHRLSVRVRSHDAGVPARAGVVLTVGGGHAERSLAETSTTAPTSGVDVAVEVDLAAVTFGLRLRVMAECGGAGSVRLIVAHQGGS
jgi:SAM-dependent methyltransferase